MRARRRAISLGVRGSLLALAALAGAIAVASVGDAAGQTVSSPPARTAPRADALWDTVTAAVEAGRGRFRVAGVSVALVHDGVISSRGYGVSDPASRTPLDPATVRVHVASVTKLFTAVAVLQLVERGVLDLDTPIERYVADRLRAPLGGRGLTLRHLLTHRSGLADRWVGLAAVTPDRVMPLADYLATHPPPQAEPPGLFPRYSNFAFGLAGHIVEQATKTAYADRLATHIFDPLSMASAYVGPRPPDDRDLRGFFYRADVTPEPFVFEHLTPAGGVHATVTDVARFVSALLAAVGGGPISPAVTPFVARAILPADDARRSAVAAWSLGVYSRDEWRDAAWVAGGEVPGLSTRILLVPTLRLGLIVAVNRKDPSLSTAVFDAVMRQVSAPAPADSVTLVPADERLDGTYRATLDDPSSFMHAASLFAPTLRIDRDGGVPGRDATHPADANRGTGVRVRFTNVNRAAAFWHLTRGDHLVDADSRVIGEVHRSERGDVARVVLEDAEAGPVTFVRVAWWQQQEATLLVVALAFLSSLAGFIWSLVSPRQRAAVLTTSVLNLGFITGFATGLAQLAVLHDDRFAFGVPAWFILVLWIPPVLAIAWIWLCLTARHVWRSLSHGGRLAIACHATASFLLLVAAYGWNLFGPHV